MEIIKIERRWEFGKISLRIKRYTTHFFDGNIVKIIINGTISIRIKECNE